MNFKSYINTRIGCSSHYLKLPATTYPKVGGKFIPDGARIFNFDFLFIGFGKCFHISDPGFTL